MRAVLGVDIGTSSSKGSLVALDGTIIASATRVHEVSRPLPGHVEMAAETWWDEFCSLARELAPGHEVVAVGVSGMGPCVVIADDAGRPLHPAILYGVDTRSTAQIASLTDELGADEIFERGGSALSTQAAGPKIVWLADNEPALFARARKLFMPASWLAWNLTGEYVLDHQSASQCTPLYDLDARAWYAPWASRIVGEIVLPELVWADAIVGPVTPSAAKATGLPAGIPVVSGTIDAWTEAISVDAHNPGDLMLMYGTTMFLVNTVTERAPIPVLWGTSGALEGTLSLAGGMATSGAITGWLRSLFGSPTYAELLAEAEVSGAGAHGLLMLPYFAGERTPIADPDARGIVAGLTLEHTRGDLYRAALEATAFGVRHNVEAIRAAGGRIDRVVAVGGGAQSDLWMQVVSDVTGLEQQVPRVTVGASYGAAYLAATSVGGADIRSWNPTARVIVPDPQRAEGYDELFELYIDLYAASVTTAHRLARRQRHSVATP